MKIAFFDIDSELYNGEKKVLENLFPDNEVSYFSEKLNKENAILAKEAEIISVFITSTLDKEVIDLLPNLKFINTSSTGFDHIDISYCKTKGIKVSNVPVYGSDTVAEFTFALMLNLSRKISKANSRLRKDEDLKLNDLYGFDLKGKLLGVLGTGKIGKNVVKIAKAFGMNILAYDLYPDMNFAKEYGFEYKSFDEVVSLSDILTLHAPSSKENFHLINRDSISKMKRGVYIINTARGTLIDTDALIWGLKEGIIAGAGLDVLEGESGLKDELKILSSPLSHTLEEYKILLENHALIDMPNVVVTPHVAFYSREAVNNIIQTTKENIKGFIAGQPINLVS